MEDKGEKPDQGFQGQAGIMLGLLIFAAATYKKAEPKLAKFWYLHKYQFIAVFVLAVLCALSALFIYFWNWWADRAYEKAITEEDETSVYLGLNEKGQRVHVKQPFRTAHTQVIGTTNAGKSESVILPWAIRDMEMGSGLLIVDGKADSSFLAKIYGYAVKLGREKDFRLFSLVHRDPSTPFNPFVATSAHEAAERVFSSFPIEHSHYRAIQSKLFLAIVSMIQGQDVVPSFSLVHQLLTDTESLAAWVDKEKDGMVKRILGNFLKQSDRDRAEQVSGLEANLSPFAFGDHAQLFNCGQEGIQFDKVLSDRLICYFQLPTMLYPFLGEATGKLVLQSFQSAVARRQLGLSGELSFFSCYLDDFQDYIYRGFGALLNKSRSANVGIVFSHQALGDLDKVGEDFRNVVLTNTNIKIVMRSNDPATCEYFAKSFGTKTSEKKTERRQTGPLGETKTGEGSVREVEEYVFHPNEIRRLGTGEAVVAIPHPRGVRTEKIKFARRPDVPPVPLPNVPKQVVDTSSRILPPGISESQKSRV